MRRSCAVSSRKNARKTWVPVTKWTRHLRICYVGDTLDNWGLIFAIVWPLRCGIEPDQEPRLFVVELKVSTQSRMARACRIRLSINEHFFFPMGRQISSRVVSKMSWHTPVMCLGTKQMTASARPLLTGISICVTYPLPLALTKTTLLFKCPLAWWVCTETVRLILAGLRRRFSWQQHSSDSRHHQPSASAATHVWSNW